MTKLSPRPVSRSPLYLVVFLFIVVIIVFVVQLAASTGVSMTAEATAELAADTYMDKVMSLLKNADPENGAALVEQYNCIACHRLGANKIAPSFVGIAARAGLRKPPLTAAAYIYESITNPKAYVVEGFSPVMPENFRERLSDRELGDIIAYLMSTDAK